MTKMYAGHHTHNNVGTQTEVELYPTRSVIDDYTCVNIDSVNKEVNPYDFDSRSHARLKSLK